MLFGPAHIPLAERMRPQNIDEYVGQEHLVGEGEVLKRMLDSGQIPSMILWGPPGVGKTTLAGLICKKMDMTFFSLSAINAGVKDVREIIAKAAVQGDAILFIDEIHRFSKSQQDSLLGAVEKGIIKLIGATTENPSFEVISALLSRCQVYVLKPFGENDLLALINKAMEKDAWLKSRNITIKETNALLRLSGGDGRKLLTLLEINAQSMKPGEVVTDKSVQQYAQQHIATYDKSGEQHYDIVSAYIKSIRGSDPNAAVYWLARMIEGGEDPKFIARRLLIAASEDIGNANPTALVLATNCFQAVSMLGYPECRIILSQTTTYLACSAKSNAAYLAIGAAQQKVKQTGDLPVPLPIRNSPTKLMKELEYGKGYQYAHDFEGNFVDQEYLPDAIKGTKFYDPGANKREEDFRKRLRVMWGEKYGY
ncbi:MAG: putative ATPase [Limisphaerales bacterium]|jgi:putative ATPase